MTRPKRPPRSQVEDEVQDIIEAAHRIIRYANQIPLEEPDGPDGQARLRDIEQLALSALRYGDGLPSVLRNDLLVYFRKWHPREVLV